MSTTGSGRFESRQCAVQILYALNIPPAGQPPNDAENHIADFWRHFGGSNDARPFADELVRGVLTAMPRVDERLQKASTNWRLDRMARIDLAILRLAVYELSESVGVPREVAIDQAVELAKLFSTQESARFINGVLAGVVSG